jgi:methionyl-tRNA formyltransferase
VHNLVRAVAPPYPGAFTDVGGLRLQVFGSYYRGEPAAGDTPRLYWDGDRCHADCADGQRILITRLASGGTDLDQEAFSTLLGSDTIPLPVLN